MSKKIKETRPGLLVHIDRVPHILRRPEEWQWKVKIEDVLCGYNALIPADCSGGLGRGDGWSDRSYATFSTYAEAMDDIKKYLDRAYALRFKVMGISKIIK